MDELTASDVLTLLADCAQRCRENGDSDMRNILNAVRSIRTMMADGKTRSEIFVAWQEEDEDA